MGSTAEKLYYHHDNLGSARLITDESGNIEWEQDYLPFGEDLYKPGTTTVNFAVNPEYKSQVNAR